MRWLPSFTLIAACCLIGAPVVAAEKIKVLDATDDCKRGRACIAVTFDVDGLASRLAKVSLKRQTQCGLQPVKVTGRLERGPVRPYVLVIEADCMPCADGSVAYLGRSVRNNPLVQTRQGVFEIVDSGISLGTPDDLLIVDSENGQVVGRYLGNYGNSGDYHFAGARVFMRHEDGVCIAAPAMSPGLLKLAPGRCPKRKNWDAETVELSAVKPAVQTTVRKYLMRPNDEPYLRPMKGTKLLALQVGDNCYQ